MFAFGYRGAGGVGDVDADADAVDGVSGALQAAHEVGDHLAQFGRGGAVGCGEGEGGFSEVGNAGSLCQRGRDVACVDGLYGAQAARLIGDLAQFAAAGEKGL